MKKIIIFILILALLLPVSILGDTGNLVLDGESIDPIWSYEDNTIYYDGDLIIDVDEDMTIGGVNGIYVTGDLSVIGDSTLTIDVSGIGIKVDGRMSVSNPSVEIINSSLAYDSPYIIDDEAYVLDENLNMAYFLDDTYYDYDLVNTLEKLTIKSKQYGDVELIDKSHTLLYKRVGEDIYSYPCVEGFIINFNESESSVYYDEDLLTYYVNIWNDFNDDGYSSNYIEFLFPISEWGKTLDYKVLEAKNFYFDDYVTLYEESSTRSPLNLIGFDQYSYSSDADTIDCISDFMLLVAKSEDNKIVLEILGEDDNNHRYINLVVNNVEEDVEEEIDDDDHDYDDDRDYYQFVNTDVEISLPNPGDLSGNYILDENKTISSPYNIVGETTINLNGHTITYKGGGSPLFNVNNNLTINGQIEGSGIVIKKNVEMVETIGEYLVSINGGQYSNTKENGDCALFNVNTGSLSIDGANITSSGGKGIIFMGDYLSVLDSLINTNDNSIEINGNNSIASFKNVDIVSSSGSPYTNNGTLTIESGRYLFDPTGFVDSKYVIGQNVDDEHYIVGYCVTFDLDNGEDNKLIYVVENEKVDRIDDPIKENEEFISWFNEETEYNFDNLVTSSFTLKAKYNSNNNEDNNEDNNDHENDDYEDDDYKKYYTIVNTGVR